MSLSINISPVYIYADTFLGALWPIISFAAGMGIVFGILHLLATTLRSTFSPLPTRDFSDEPIQPIDIPQPKIETRQPPVPAHPGRCGFCHQRFSPLEILLGSTCSHCGAPQD